MHYQVKFSHIKRNCFLNQLPPDSLSFLISQTAKNFSDCDLVLVAANDTMIEELELQLRFFNSIDNDFEIIKFNAWDCLPYDRNSPKPFILSGRIKALSKLSNRQDDKRFLIITSFNAISQKVINKSDIRGLALNLEVGSKISIDQISKFLVLKGYERQSVANDVGDFALRGGIVDIVTRQAADLVGYRIDFFGEEVDSIKIFDPLTQITSEEVRKLEILPASEVIINEENINNFRKSYRTAFGNVVSDQLYNAISEGRSFIGMEHWLPFFYSQDLVSFFDYLKDPVIFTSSDIYNLAKKKDDLVSEYYSSRVDDLKTNSEIKYYPIAPNLLYYNSSEIAKILDQFRVIKFSQFAIEGDGLFNLGFKSVPDFALAGRTNQKDPIDLFKDFITSINNFPNIKVIIACISEGFINRLLKLLPDYGLYGCEISTFEEAKSLKKGVIGLTRFPTGSGFYSEDLILVGQTALFGEIKLRKKSTNKEAAKRLIDEGLSINVGDLVIHRDHGIGKFDGIHTITAGQVKSDMIKLIYGGGDNLFVPVDEINSITRYGDDNYLIQLDRLGVAAWKNRKAKIRKKIQIAAEKLLEIAAKRALQKAPIFVPEQHFYEEFQKGFGFVETEDQMQAINDVEDDLRKGSPMDRLICGDVGFGKTEVAMRAAAIIVSQNQQQKNNKFQVAIITPTTLLCRQHYQSFIERFVKSKVEIAQLSRLVTIGDSKVIRERIESGEVEIVIGTHALLHKNIKFKNLSLVIIDEEQHFGVAQKERLKELKNQVHLLTLSATPIPRTLQMSLTGVKDLSLIASPPIDRLAVRNFVMPYDSIIVRESVMREYNRSGSVFFVVPRVRDIEEIEPRLKILLPEIKITHAHGQMSPIQLDKIMNDFTDGKIDLLLSTTIIESGIDISKANTMIIYKAEMFGLSQLYQLRGRVGRSKLRGYCYFMLDNRKKPSKEAMKKLEVMQNIDSLGVGFTVSSHDMDIRGSGNVLGDEQSGHIKETGIELYQQMLFEAIEKMKNSPNAKIDDEIEIINTQIKLGISLLIPEEYISDLSLRMSFYKRIANISSDMEEDHLLSEMKDRFGNLPEEIYSLTEVSKIKHLCKKLGIAKLEAICEGIIITFLGDKFSNPQGLMDLVLASKGQIKIIAGHKLVFICDTKTLNSKIKSSYNSLAKLQTLVKLT